VKKKIKVNQNQRFTSLVIYVILWLLDTNP